MDVVYLSWEGPRLPSSCREATRLPRRVTCNNTCNKLREVLRRQLFSMSVFRDSRVYVILTIGVENGTPAYSHGLAAAEMSSSRRGLLLLARSTAPAASSRKHPRVVGPR